MLLPRFFAGNKAGVDSRAGGLRKPAPQDPAILLMPVSDGHNWPQLPEFLQDHHSLFKAHFPLGVEKDELPRV